MLDSILTVAGIAGGVVALGALGSFGVANILFNKIIPRQDGVKVDMKEMADAGIVTDAVSPKLLPDYARKVNQK